MRQDKEAQLNKRKTKKDIKIDSTDIKVNQEGIELQKELDDGEGLNGITTEFKI